MDDGAIANIPQGCIIEVPGYVDRNGINIPVYGDLPMACAATCSVSINVQEMAMEAGVHDFVLLLKQAISHDPHVWAVCDPEEIWQMTDEMLVAQAEWLPQYADEIPAAKARLEAHVVNGTRVKTMEGFEGMARQRQ